MALYNNDTIYNSDHFDLTEWRLTIPVDSTGGTTGTAATIDNLVGYESQFFYDAADGAMVFDAPVGGAESPNTHYARSELREMNGSQHAAWNLAEGGTMTATLKVERVPTLFDGKPGKVVIGQIHGQTNELCRLYWDNGTVYFKDDLAGPNNTEQKFVPTDAHGQAPVIPLGEKFSYLIDAHGNTLTVQIRTATDTYTSAININPIWQSDTLYFKAGVYLGVNATNGTGVGQDAFYGLDFGHAAGTGLGGLKALASPPASTSIIGTSGNDVLNAHPKAGTSVYGGAGNDTIWGHDGNDMLFGQLGDDKLYGGIGDDVLKGGPGADLLAGGPGNDRLDGGGGQNRLVGGGGADRFEFTTLSIGTHIADFTHGIDKIGLSQAVFGSLNHVSYHAATGALVFDPDGPGGHAPIPFATLAAHLTIDHGDFLLL